MAVVNGDEWITRFTCEPNIGKRFGVGLGQLAGALVSIAGQCRTSIATICVTCDGEKDRASMSFYFADIATRHAIFALNS